MLLGTRRKTMKNQLAQILRDKGLRQQDLAEALGVSRQTVGYWTKSETLSAKTAASLSSYLGVPIGALLGVPVDGSEAVVKVTGDEPRRPGFERITVYEVEGACGPSGVENGTELVAGFVDIAAWFVNSLPGVTSARSLQIISSSGDSMEPTIAKRSLVLVDTAQTRLSADGVYCLRVEAELYIKRVQRNLDGTLVLHSDNKLYEPMRIRRDDLPLTAIVGRVVYVFNGSGV
jgi:transcriptional regulator with XRE-family HTH domain